MLSTKRVLLGLLVLGVLGMHALVTSGGTTATAAAAHHAWPAAVSHASHASDVTAGDTADGTTEEETVLALCMALLAGFAVAAVVGRRTTWVSLLNRVLTREPRPPTPALRGRTPVPRFTVMRC